MQLSHNRPVSCAVFEDPNLVSAAGLVPTLALARATGLHDLVAERLIVPTDKGANAGLKVASLVAGMAAGADGIDDMALAQPFGVGGRRVGRPPDRPVTDAELMIIGGSPASRNFRAKSTVEK
jgi:hypothetical protein